MHALRAYMWINKDGMGPDEKTKESTMNTITLSVAVLRADGRIAMQDVDVDHTKSIADQMAIYGSGARKSDPTIAAIRYVFTRPCANWIGHATDEHMEAIAQAERDGRW